MPRAKAKLDIVSATTKPSDPKTSTVVISPPKFQVAPIKIVGTSPLVLHRFSVKAKNMIIETQESGSVARKGKKREAKDFNAVYEAAKYISREGWLGLPASAFRNAAISACRIVGFKMTLAKLSLFVEADGYDALDNTPLIRITGGEPEMHLAPARNANGAVDIRARPMWTVWGATVRMRWDSDQFSATDIANLMMRIGCQIGVGEGRPDSRMSAGCGWGTFELG